MKRRLCELGGNANNPRKKLLDGWYDNTIGNIVKLADIIKSRKTYNKGTSQGGGAGGRFKQQQSYSTNNFNEAYDRAVENNDSIFVFNGRNYNTLRENNPVREANNRVVGLKRRRDDKDTNKGYAREAGPIRGTESIIPIITATYNKNRKVRRK